jgi:hypothetical protein
MVINMSISKMRKLASLLIAAIIITSCASCANTPTTVESPTDGDSTETASPVTQLPTPSITTTPEAAETETSEASPAETSPPFDYVPELDNLPASFTAVTSSDRIYTSKLIGITVELPEEWEGMFEFREGISNKSLTYNFASLSIYTKPQPVPDDLENLHTYWIASFTRYRKDIWERMMTPGDEIVSTEVPRDIVAEDENSIVVLSYPHDVQYDGQRYEEIGKRYRIVEEGLHNGEYKAQIDKSIPG